MVEKNMAEQAAGYYITRGIQKEVVGPALNTQWTGLRILKAPPDGD